MSHLGDQGASPNAPLTAKDFFELFVQCSSMLMHPRLVLDLLKPIADSRGIPLPSEESILAMLRLCRGAVASLQPHVSGELAAKPAGKSGKKTSGSGEGKEKKEKKEKTRAGKVSPYTIFSAALLQLMHTHGLHPKLKAKADEVKQQHEVVGEEGKKKAGGSMRVAGAFWSDLSQEQKDEFQRLYTPLIDLINKEKAENFQGGVANSTDLTSKLTQFQETNPKARMDRFLGIKVDDSHRPPIDPEVQAKQAQKDAKRLKLGGSKAATPIAAPAPAQAQEEDDDDDEDEDESSDEEDAPPAAAPPKPSTKPATPSAAVPDSSNGKKRKGADGTAAAVPSSSKAVAPSAAAPASPAGKKVKHEVAAPAAAAAKLKKAPVPAPAPFVAKDSSSDEDSDDEDDDE